MTGFSRASEPDIDLTDEQTILRAAAAVKDSGLDLRLVFDATGFLHGCGFKPEKTLSAITPSHMAHAFAINALGPALLMKHFLPLLAKDGKSVFATLSAKVGSIGDNALGGWYSYRAPKAALNQFVHSAAIELARKRPEALCVALHPGTVGHRAVLGLCQERADGARPRRKRQSCCWVSSTGSPRPRRAGSSTIAATSCPGEPRANRVLYRWWHNIGA